MLADAVERHHPRLVMACSFQKEESVLIDMLMAIEPAARVFTIDTGALFPDTYEVWRKLEDRYDLARRGVRCLEHERSLERRRTAAAPARWPRSTARSRAWTPGSRASAASSRPPAPDAPKEEWMESRGIWKFNPLADWTEDDVWRYVHEHDLPYHPLHDRGYDSIGCAPCTLPGNGRNGRWAGQEKTECGLHV